MTIFREKIKISIFQKGKCQGHKTGRWDPAPFSPDFATYKGFLFHNKF